MRDKAGGVAKSKINFIKYLYNTGWDIRSSGFYFCTLMKNYNLLEASILALFLPIAYLWRISRRAYRRFCIKVLWKRFRIRTSTYRKWHDRQARNIQRLLDEEHNIKIVMA